MSVLASLDTALFVDVVTGITTVGGVVFGVHALQVGFKMIRAAVGEDSGGGYSSGGFSDYSPMEEAHAGIVSRDYDAAIQEDLDRSFGARV